MDKKRGTYEGREEGMPLVRPVVQRKVRYNAEGVHVDLFHVKQRIDDLHRMVSALWRLQAHSMGKWTTEEVLQHEADAHQCESLSLPPDVNAVKEGE